MVPLVGPVVPSGADGADRGGSDNGLDSCDSPDPPIGRHDILGPCPRAHSVSRDCDCSCYRCLESPTKDIKRTIRERIREGRHFHREADRFDHGPTPDPHHNEGPGVLLPLLPPGNAGMPSFHRTRPDGGGDLVQMPFVAFDIVDEYVSDIPLLASSDRSSSNSSESAGNLTGLSKNQILHRKFPSDRRSHHSFTLAMGQRPCTEWIPWNYPTRRWKLPCPNDRRKLSAPRGIISWPCNEPNCSAEQPGEIIVQYDHEGMPISQHEGDFDDDYELENVEMPPGESGTHNGNRWVCAQHRADSAQYWQEDSLLEAHLIPPCDDCREYYARAHPYGFSSCTCRNLLRRWQCRRCYEKKIRMLQTHFRRRIGVRYTGGVDVERLGIMPPDSDDDGMDEGTVDGPGVACYHKDGNWRKVRKQVVEDHPCTNPGHSRNCGGQRVIGNRRKMKIGEEREKRRKGLGRGVNVKGVWHCRSCGGVVVKSERVAPVRTRARGCRETTDVAATATAIANTSGGPGTGRGRGRRGRSRAVSPLLELTFVGGKAIARNQ